MTQGAGDRHPCATCRLDEPALRLMMRRLLFLSLVVAGCAGSTTTKPPIQNTAPRVRLVCDAAQLEKLGPVIADRFGVHGVELRCIAGEFGGTPGFFVEAVAGSMRRVGIVDPSGTELVGFVDEPHEASSFITNFWTADLDGDGQDEVIESWRRTASFAQQPDSWLVVRVVSDRKLRRVKGPYLSRYHPELGGCSATWELRTGAIIVAVDVLPGIPPTDCLPAGKHRFSLVGTTLVDSLGRRRR
jgi:hypothetical protein